MRLSQSNNNLSEREKTFASWSWMEFYDYWLVSEWVSGVTAIVGHLRNSKVVQNAGILWEWRFARAHQYHTHKCIQKDHEFAQFYVQFHANLRAIDAFEMKKKSNSKTCDHENFVKSKKTKQNKQLCNCVFFPFVVCSSTHKNSCDW